ncbi:MAG: hypothetical protein GEV28_17425 [Actinophytocola sp.]|uniref:hypothetical protein n=1 Tax=Actinophytocola sp. TaxID=1872138 RepID=UPI0013265C1D|nr:hypothetical protein [Actinophytocola sp.]MPZ82070.1 hypothetical protein [Actinophytocola sp.]
MDHGESVLMAKLAGLNTRIARFILGTHDRDAARPSAGDGVELGRDLVALGRAVQRHARLRTAPWGHSYLEPQRGHVRATKNGTTTVSVIDGAAVGPAVCGAWLVADLPNPNRNDFTACSACLAALGQEPC